MRIEKRTMNWLPRPSLYQQNEAARAKRQSFARRDMSLQQSLAASLSAASSSTSIEQVNLAIRVAAERVQAAAKARAQDALKRS